MKGMEMIVLVAVIAGILVFVYFLEMTRTQYLNKEIGRCLDICESNGMEFNNYKSVTYSNDICFCKNKNGGIQTFMV